MSSIPAGWYNDPGSSGHLRYWSGEAWTEHLKAVDLTPAPPPSASVSPSPQVASTGLAPADVGPAVVTPVPSADIAASGAWPAASEPRPSAASTWGGTEGVESAANPFAAFGAQLDAPQNPAAGYSVSPFGAAAQDPHLAGNAAVLGGLFGTRRNGGGGLFNAIGLIIFGLISIAFMNVALGFFEAANTAPPGSISVVGTVADLEYSGSNCSPVVDVVVDAETRTARSNISTSPCPWAIGDPATVAYIPGNFEGTATIIDESGTLGLVHLGGNVVGVLLIVGGIVQLIRRSRDIRRGMQQMRA